MAATDITAEGAVYMVLLALQYGMQPIASRRCLPPSVPRPIIVLITEGLKFVLAFVTLAAAGSLRTSVQGWTLFDSVGVAGLPAFIYSFQNLLAQYAYMHLDGLTFNLMNQSKILFTAMFLFLLMGRRQSKQQILALALLLVVSVMIRPTTSTPAAGNGDAKPTGFMGRALESITQLDFGALYVVGSDAVDALVNGDEATFGLICGFLAAVLSGLASALCQRGVQATGRNSLLFSMELAVYSAITLVLYYNFYLDEDILNIDDYLSLSFVNFVPMLMSGGGGLCVGLVTKHAGAVRKAFSILAGILLTGGVEYAIGEKPLRPEVIYALPLAIVSVYLHISYPYKAPPAAADDKKKKT